MQKVTRYKCEWCGKEFRTPDRHLCKWRPEVHNCLSCAYRGAFVKGEPARQVDFGEWEDGVANSFMCHCKKCFDDPKSSTGQGGWNDFPSAAYSDNEKELGSGKPICCRDWKMVPGYKGKKTYCEVESKRHIASPLLLSAEELLSRTDEDLAESRKKLIENDPKYWGNPFQH